ncbi:MAG TPA: SRPBCC family protein [Caulobacterales bacterium]|nr:SRPBCC family protein [Caulobacterales bacterium]
MSEGAAYVYVTYIRTTQEKLWAYLTTPEFTREYWFGCTAESDFRAGSSWKLIYPDGKLADSGEILEADPPRRLVIRWRNEWKPENKAEGYTRCTMELEAADGAIKLTITHALEKPLPRSLMIEAVSGGWPKVLSNLKSVLETGAPALGKPY